jgi:hypothetical protein
MLPLGPEFFDTTGDLTRQAEGYVTCRVIFGTVTQDRDSAGGFDLNDFTVNVSADGQVYSYVPVPNPNPVSGGVRPLAARVGDRVMLLQFIDGTTICLGRVVF